MRPMHDDRLPHSPIRPFPHSRWVAGLVLLLLASLSAVVPASADTPRAVVERAARHYDAVNDYVVQAKLTMQSPTVHMPETNLTIYFKKPNKVHIESKDGFAMIPKHGVAIGNPVRELISGARLTMERTERYMGVDCYVILAESESEGRSLQATLWVDKKDYLVRKVSSNPEWGPSVDMRVSYIRVRGKYWLPSVTTASVSIPPMPGARPVDKGKPIPPTLVTLRFSNYRVNVGLNDTIFSKREGSK